LREYLQEGLAELFQARTYVANLAFSRVADEREMPRLRLQPDILRRRTGPTGEGRRDCDQKREGKSECDDVTLHRKTSMDERRYRYRARELAVSLSMGECWHSTARVSKRAPARSDAFLCALRRANLFQPRMNADIHEPISGELALHQALR
jgi:hypothetical protein